MLRACISVEPPRIPPCRYGARVYAVLYRTVNGLRTMGVYAPATGLVRRDGQPSITGNTGVSPPIGRLPLIGPAVHHCPLNIRRTTRSIDDRVTEIATFFGHFRV